MELPPHPTSQIYGYFEINFTQHKNNTEAKFAIEVIFQPSVFTKEKGRYRADQLQKLYSI